MMENYRAPAPGADSTEDLRQLLAVANENDSARWEIGFRNIVAILYGPRHKFEIADVVERIREIASPAVGAEDEREPLSLAVVDAARAAMDESVEAFTDRMDIIIPAHLASALSLRLDEYDRAHGIGAAHPPVQGTEP